MESWINSINSELQKTVCSIQNMIADLHRMKDTMTEQENKLYWIWVRMVNYDCAFTDIERKSMEKLRQDLTELATKREQLISLSKGIEEEVLVLIKKLDSVQNEEEILSVISIIKGLNLKMNILNKEYQESNPIYFQYAEDVSRMNQNLYCRIKEESVKKKLWNKFFKKRGPNYE